MKKIIILLATILILSSCTKNQRARHIGGTETITLLPSAEFINITWKKENLWVIVRDKETGEFYAREKSSFGVLEGRIIIKQSK